MGKAAEQPICTLSAPCEGLDACSSIREEEFWGPAEINSPKRKAEGVDEFRFYAKEELACSGLLMERLQTSHELTVRNLVDFDVCNCSGSSPKQARQLVKPSHSQMHSALVRMLEARHRRELIAATILNWRFAVVEAKHTGALGALQQENAKLKVKLRNVVNFLAVRM
eukprot:gnl/TRDRNA2_/TRDRNA2_37024_c0_seq1.p1 gnl/TRDRNA2_/TRDRNA2_37024_c0~~gnl/TRDRNA2_/TRDRNA2_37024_c0_seq1.p1  ORF type:complete len:190 (-),score=36.21 gnl/TRDRNA2_/TRDRNA2_37024_c0_seq1:77-580(-)